MTLLDELISAFCCLPGVGHKSAQRISLHLLERNRKGGQHLADVLAQAMKNIGNCEMCNTFSEEKTCRLCSNNSRQDDLLCIVETPMDVLAIEQSASFNGKYFVLMGYLSPIDGVTASDLGLDKLKQRLNKKIIKEIILATNPTVEGEVTAEYIRSMARPLGILVSKIAYGVPLGGELGFTDQGTISHALLGRIPFNG